MTSYLMAIVLFVIPFAISKIVAVEIYMTLTLTFVSRLNVYVPI